MRRNEGLTGADAGKQEQLILSLLRHKTKAEAALKAGVSTATMYRWFQDPKFLGAYRLARRMAFDEALAVLEKGSLAAAQALVDEIGEMRTGEPVLVNAATRVLDRAFKAMESIEVDEELASLRAVIEELKAASRPKAPLVVPIDTTRYRMTEKEKSEAVCLRVAWMAELGHVAQDIESSLRYNWPQSVSEEQELLDVVRKLLEVERTYHEVIRTMSAV